MLQAMNYDFQMLEQFDPIICMQRLYGFHAELRQLQENLYSSPIKSTGNLVWKGEETVRYGADDFYDEASGYSDEDLAEEQQFEEYDQFYFEQNGSDNGEY